MSFDLKKIKCLIFDFDGVIADTDNGRFNALCEVLARKGIDLKKISTIDDLVGVRTKRFLKDKFPSFSTVMIEEIISERRQLFFSHLEKYCMVYPGAIDTIRDLHNLGYRLHMVTSNDAYTINKLLAFIGISQFFSSILAREQTENAETGLKDYGLVLDILDKKAGECIVIEDSPIGVTAAKNEGLFCIAFERFESPILTEKADLIVHNYDELRQTFFS